VGVWSTRGRDKGSEIKCRKLVPIENTRARARVNPRSRALEKEERKKSRRNAFLSDDRRSFNCDINNARKGWQTCVGALREAHGAARVEIGYYAASACRAADKE